MGVILSNRLGANGAGKTTLLKMVSGLEIPSGGVALINGFDVVNSRSSAQRSMGLWYERDILIFACSDISFCQLTAHNLILWCVLHSLLFPNLFLDYVTD